jgi:hypothetical protein
LTPGPPYIAKWPDEYGNIKHRKVPRPEIVGKYFGVSNKIDTHNQLRQHELALEELWSTQDCWFRLDTTFIGMTVTDAFQLARYSCSTGSGVRRMSVKDFAMRTCHDMFTRKTSREPFAENIVHATTTTLQQQHNTLNSPMTYFDAQAAHPIKKTQQRDGSGNPTRRHCQIKEEGCETRAMSRECQHPACMATKKPGSNRHGDTFGVFICDNQRCMNKHWSNVVELSRVERS